MRGTPHTGHTLATHCADASSTRRTVVLGGSFSDPMEAFADVLPHPLNIAAAEVEHT